MNPDQEEKKYKEGKLIAYLQLKRIAEERDNEEIPHHEEKKEEEDHHREEMKEEDDHHQEEMTEREEDRHPIHHHLRHLIPPAVHQVMIEEEDEDSKINYEMKCYP